MGWDHINRPQHPLIYIYINGYVFCCFKMPSGRSPHTCFIYTLYTHTRVCVCARGWVCGCFRAFNEAPVRKSSSWGMDSKASRRCDITSPNSCGTRRIQGTLSIPKHPHTLKREVKGHLWVIYGGFFRMAANVYFVLHRRPKKPTWLVETDFGNSGTKSIRWILFPG